MFILTWAAQIGGEATIIHLELIEGVLFPMARTTSARSKKANPTNGDKPAASSNVRVITAPNSLEDEIRTRAYALYEQEGHQPGRDQEYWLRAESEIMERYGLRRA